MDIRKWLQGAAATRPPPTPPPTENEENAPSSSIAGTTSEELEPCSSASQYTPASQAHPPAAANLCKKPTVAVHYKGVHLKRLLEQRWTGHLATVSVIIKSFNDITSLLTEINYVMAHGAEIRMEATGLLHEMTEPSFPFIAQLVHTVLALLHPPNNI
ncbi:hypothetical protein JOQ06_002539 [Pogonophryne albipinna]|uniref:Uncharacterized protein n=1 Tax=Pogonophryne albipinna TaxID=1090488 RepID=A0AAD6B619_9TELE|nr:hypothetical protein JOQ06_002539 [Pogonophryne albipinna]